MSVNFFLILTVNQLALTHAEKIKNVKQIRLRQFQTHLNPRVRKHQLQSLTSIFKPYPHAPESVYIKYNNIIVFSNL